MDDAFNSLDVQRSGCAASIYKECGARRRLTTRGPLGRPPDPVPWRTLPGSSKRWTSRAKSMDGGLAGGPGFEPRLTGSEPVVLPLNYPPSGRAERKRCSDTALPWQGARRPAPSLQSRDLPMRASMLTGTDLALEHSVHAGSICGSNIHPRKQCSTCFPGKPHLIACGRRRTTAKGCK